MGILEEIAETAGKISEAERKLYRDAPKGIGANMARCLRLKEEYNRLIDRYERGERS